MNGSDFQAQNWQILNGDAIRGMKLDIAKAYPENANLKWWNRSLLLEDGEQPCIKLTEYFSLSKTATYIHFSLIICFMPEPAMNAFILNSKLKITSDSEKLKAKIERLELNDQRLSESWGQDHVYRLLFQYEGKNLANEIQFQLYTID